MAGRWTGGTGERKSASALFMAGRKAIKAVGREAGAIATRFITRRGDHHRVSEIYGENDMVDKWTDDDK